MGETKGESMSWTDRASCKGKPMEWFFPKVSVGRIPPQAEALCNVCPVKKECGEYGLYERHGYWGGMSENMRRQERRRRRDMLGMRHGQRGQIKLIDLVEERR